MEKKIIPPFRIGRKQKRAVLDSQGKEIVVFPIGMESYAADYCNYLNRNTVNKPEVEKTGEQKRLKKIEEINKELLFSYEELKEKMNHSEDFGILTGILAGIMIGIIIIVILSLFPGTGIILK